MRSEVRSLRAAGHGHDAVVALGTRRLPDEPDAAHVPASVRVVLVDDDALLVQALAAALDAVGSFDVVGVAEDVETAIRVAASAQPDVVVVGHRPPSVREFELVDALKLLRPTPAVLLVSSSDASSVAAHALRAQCDGLLPRRSSLECFMAAVRTVAGGQCVYTNEQLVGALGGEVAGRADAAPPDLTTRELQVLWLLNEGVSTGGIAQVLGVSVNTVRSHIRNILGKFGAHSRLEAIAAARRSGVLDEMDDPRGDLRSTAT